MFVVIGKLINLYFFIIIVTHRIAKKHYINIAFYNFEIKCTQNKTEFSHSKMATFICKDSNDCLHLTIKY